MILSFMLATEVNDQIFPTGCSSCSSNKTGVAVSITSIAVTGTDAGDFSQTNTCDKSVAGGASCFITVTFKPSATGIRGGAVLVTDNRGGSPQKVSVTGVGT